MAITMGLTNNHATMDFHGSGVEPVCRPPSQFYVNTDTAAKIQLSTHKR
jgi:hypothetical protein